MPMHLMNFFNGETVEKYGRPLHDMVARYPNDVIAVGYPQPDWNTLADTRIDESIGLDNRAIIRDYNKIHEQAERIREFGRNLDMSQAKEIRAANLDRYCSGSTWFALYERLWSLRGMENTLIDFYEQPDEVKVLMRAICDFHISAIHEFGKLGYDAISISDDLGTQISTMFSPAVFDEFYRPLYTEMFGAAHEYGMHTWMHCCGYMESLLPGLIDAGLDVIHPVQHSTFPGGVSANDPRRIVEQFGGKITFWAGVDVQYLLPRGTVDDVRRGIREMIDTFDGPNGGMVVAAGNGIMPETPFENIEAFFDETYQYGQTKRRSV